MYPVILGVTGWMYRIFWWSPGFGWEFVFLYDHLVFQNLIFLRALGVGGHTLLFLQVEKCLVYSKWLKIVHVHALFLGKIRQPLRTVKCTFKSWNMVFWRWYLQNSWNHRIYICMCDCIDSSWYFQSLHLMVADIYCGWKLVYRYTVAFLH